MRQTRIARARKTGFADFVQEAAFSEIKEKRDLVKRSFTNPGIVGSFCDLWKKDWLGGAICVADSDALNLDVCGHDLLIHAMGLHHHNDPLGQLIQMRRALRPDGLCLAVMLGGETLAELRAALAETESALRGGLSPRVAPMADIRALGGLLHRAGLALPVADRLPLRVRYRDVWALMRDLRAMGETNILRARDPRPLDRRFMAHLDAVYRTHFADGDGIRATFELVFLTGWAPDPSQQQPLRPGSAQQSLAEALKAGPPRLS